MLMVTMTATKLMAWEQASRTVHNPDTVTHIVDRPGVAACGARIRSIGPEWPPSKADWAHGIRRCAGCELVAFGGLR